MGQRHQIYVKLPKELGTVGFHHQWLYGMTAVESLARVVKFYLNGDEYSPLKASTGYGPERVATVIQSLYSTDVESGYWHFVHILEGENGKEAPEVMDPRNGDNNDGITIIDLSKGDFRYCFMNIGHLEGEVNPTELKPMTAREYLLCYYPKFLEKQGRLDWRHKEKTGEELRLEIEQSEFDKVLHALLRIEENTKLLTLAECKKLFPKMYPKAVKEKSNVIKLKQAK